jgi:hypothetical protein
LIFMRTSLNPVHGEVYFIQHYVIKFVLRFPPPINNHHDIAEILLKVALNTINPAFTRMTKK